VADTYSCRMSFLVPVPSTLAVASACAARAVPARQAGGLGTGRSSCEVRSFDSMAPLFVATKQVDAHHLSNQLHTPMIAERHKTRVKRSPTGVIGDVAAHIRPLLGGENPRVNA
jgi:hypothetical protein